jgi:hypothetical protein
MMTLTMTCFVVLVHYGIARRLGRYTTGHETQGFSTHGTGFEYSFLVRLLFSEGNSLDAFLFKLQGNHRL